MTTTQIPTGTGVSFTATTTSPFQTAFLQLILNAATMTPANNTTVFNVNAQPREMIALRTATLIDLPYGFDTITGSAAVPLAEVILDNANATYVTSLTGVSVVVAVDGAFSNIINNNAAGGMIAVTGAGQNQIEGLAGANQIITGIGGTDNVVLGGGSNSLTSNGVDTVQISGPSTITATATGTDAIQILNNAAVAFLNTSTSAVASTVNGAANAVVDLVGPGSTSVSAGAGQEYYFVDTSAGNVTLNVNPFANDALTLVADAPNGGAAIQVNGLGTGSIVAIHGYSTYSVAQSATTPGSAVLALSDGTQVMFTGTSTAAVLNDLRLT